MEPTAYTPEKSTGMAGRQNLTVFNVGLPVPAFSGDVQHGLPACRCSGVVCTMPNPFLLSHLGAQSVEPSQVSSVACTAGIGRSLPWNCTAIRLGMV
jgi:hypothetical protein